MKQNRSEREAELIADLFHESWDSGEVAGYARKAARRTRRRRILRKSLAAAGIALLLATLSFFFVRSPSSAPTEQPFSSANASPENYEVISTDQLLSAIRDRPILVVRNGKSEKVILLSKN